MKANFYGNELKESHQIAEDLFCIFRRLHPFFQPLSLRLNILKIVTHFMKKKSLSVVYTNLHERENVSRDSGLVEYVYSSGHFVKTQLIAVCSFQRLKPFKWLCLDEQLKFQKLVHFFCGV